MKALARKTGSGTLPCTHAAAGVPYLESAPGQDATPKSLGTAVNACRQAGTGRELASSQQFAVWEVGELGIVLAFRGTASFEDAIVDIAMTPVPLQLPRGKISGVLV